MEELLASIEELLAYALPFTSEELDRQAFDDQPFQAKELTVLLF